jgi:hypothetical protein
MKGPRQVLVLGLKKPGRRQRRLGPFSALAQESANQDKQARGRAMKRFKVVCSKVDPGRPRLIQRYFMRGRDPEEIRKRCRKNPWWGVKIHSIQEIPTVIIK